MASICSACYLLQAGYLLRLFFDTDDVGDISFETLVDFQRNT
jgi:hypothetical protein